MQNTAAITPPEIASTSTPAPSAAPKRFVGIDIIKILAALLVVCVHIFLYTGFYSEPITESFGAAPICLRWIAYCCVPLFMITTGYLMKNKTLEKGYYKGLIRILIIYLIISVICVQFNIYHFKLEYTPWTFLKGIFMFTNANYAWYIEYYISMFLLIPFINLAFNNLKDKRQRLIMVVTVVLLTMVAQSLYIGNDYDTQIKLLPGWFNRCYPFGYYLIGCYIRQYPPKRSVANKLLAMALLLIALTWVTTTTYFQSLQNVDNNFVMRSWHYNDYGSWPVMCMSVGIFLLLFDISCSYPPLCKVLQIVGNATLGTFLISYVFDTIFHSKNSGMYPTVAERLEQAPILVLKIFGCSLACGLVIHTLYDLCAKGIAHLCKKVKGQHAATKKAN